MTLIAEVGLTPTDTVNSWRLVTNQMVDRWNNLGTYDAIVITGGTINGTQIGQSTPQAGTFTNLTVNNTCDLHSATLVIADNQLSGDWVSGGTITSVVVELSNPTPTLSQHAASKSYVDGQVSAINLAPYALTSSISAVGLSGAYSSLTGTPSLGSLAPLSTVTTSYITNNAVTYAKMQAISTAYSVLGNNTGSAGAVSEIACSTATMTFLALTTTAAMASNIGLGTSNTVKFSSVGVGVTAPAAGNIQINKTATFSSELANGTQTSSFNIDWTAAQKQSVVLANSGLTMTFTNPLGPCHVQLRVIQDSSGSRTKGSWPTIKSPGGSVGGALSSGANAVDILNLFFDGTYYWGQLSLNWV